MTNPKKSEVSKVKRCHPDPLNPKEIGARIASARKRRGWRQRDLATATGLSMGAVAGWECGTRTPQTEALNRLSTALRRKCDWLLHGKRRLWNRKA